MPFKFLQSIQTPQGPGHIIGYMPMGLCQVARWVYRDGKRICINSIYPISAITEAKIAPRHTKPERVPVSHVADVAQE